MGNNIFVSYSHKDAETVVKIVEVIKKSTGMEVWYDSSLRGGENYFSVIANQIMKSKFFVFIVSDNSISSDWCLRELEFAASERKIIVAIWLDNVSLSPRVKLVIQNTQYINYYSSTTESFFVAISRAFLENSSQQVTSYRADDENNDLIWKETYFLDHQKIKKIEELLAKERQKKYSACFQAENAYLLGLAYELGIGAEIDLKHAEFYYRVSDYKGSYDGKYLYAAIRLKQENADAAALLAEMVNAAEHKSVFALTYLGDDYYYGKNGFDKDIEKAYSFWKTAAEAGGVTAMYYMAYGHRVGEYVEEDYELSCMYSLMAIEYGFPRAYRNLGFMYEYGNLFDQNNNSAIEMFEEAIKRGDYLSLCYEGLIYGNMGDYNKRRELYEKAVTLAEEGKIESGLPFYRMGYLYEYGEGVLKDTKKAIEYYLLAADRKHNNALKYTVSTILKLVDPVQIETYLNRAYVLDCENAAFELGMIEKSKGDGKKYSEKTVEFFVHGAENGDINCALQLILNYSLVLGNGKNRNDRLEAIKWFQFFFANMDEKFMKLLRDNNLLASHYYAYAIELDYDPDVNLPDREYVKLYFQKSLDESPVHLDQIVHFVVGGYLYPEDTDSGLKLDVIHAEEMLELSEKYLVGYHNYIIHNKASEASNLWNGLMSSFKKGYNKIAECYNSGTSVPKDKLAAKLYRSKAEEIVQTMKALS